MMCLSPIAKVKVANHRRHSAKPKTLWQMLVKLVWLDKAHKRTKVFDWQVSLLIRHLATEQLLQRKTQRPLLSLQQVTKTRVTLLMRRKSSLADSRWRILRKCGKSSHKRRQTNGFNCKRRLIFELKRCLRTSRQSSTWSSKSRTKNFKELLH